MNRSLETRARLVYDDVMTTTTHEPINTPLLDMLLRGASADVARKATRYLLQDRVKLVAWNPNGKIRTYTIEGDTDRWPVIIDLDFTMTTCACPSGRARPIHENGPICSHVLAAMCYWGEVDKTTLEHYAAEPPPVPVTDAGVRCGRCNRGNTRDDDVVYHATPADVKRCYGGKL